GQLPGLARLSRARARPLAAALLPRARARGAVGRRGVRPAGRGLRAPQLRDRAGAAGRGPGADGEGPARPLGVIPCRPIPLPVRVLVDGEVRAVSEGGGTRVVRIEGLSADRELRVELAAPGAESPPPDRYWPERVRTLPAPRARRTATFATLNDLHFGEPKFGGRLTADHEYGDEDEGFPLIRADDTEVPYWRIMNEDAIAEINAAQVDAAFV